MEMQRNPESQIKGAQITQMGHRKCRKQRTWVREISRDAELDRGANDGHCRGHAVI